MAVGVAVAGVLVVAAVAILLGTVDNGPDHPDSWDPRVADLAAFVEKERGLKFDHPVYVDFLSASEYTDASTADESAVSPEDRADLDRYAGQLRAFGVASGKIDLFAAYNAVSDGGTSAFYSSTDERVRVRGTELTVGLRVTLVHELTHALQDQHFDLDRLNGDEVDSSESGAFRALIEGDAVRVEETYQSDELTTAEQAEYDKEFAGELKDSEASTKDVPAFVNASFAVPYVLGKPFLMMLVNDDGNDAVDAAFASPPDTEEHLFDPASYLAKEEGRHVDLDLDADIEVLDDGPFGSPSWYLMLAERIDPLVAFEATLGWAGDAYATFEREGHTCVRVSFAGDSTEDEDQMAAALDQWAAAMPGGVAEAIDVAGHPGLESCDPGEDVDMQVTGRSEDALNLPTLWAYLIADAATALDADRSRCYAHAVLQGLTYAQIIDPEGTAFQGDGFQRKLQDSFEACA